MSQIEKEALTEQVSSVSTLKVGVYTIYDCVLKQFGAPISIPVMKVNDYFTMLVNDVNSPYYNHETDYILNKIGDFNQDSGEIEMHFVERVCLLDSFINQNKRNLQTIITTLNYLPQGYFKMPAEQKQLIQEQINNAVNDYVKNYVVPDLDVSSEKCKMLESELEDYKERFSVANSNSIYSDIDDSGIGMNGLKKDTLRD